MKHSILTTALLFPIVLYLLCTNPTSPTDDVVTADMYEPDNTRLTAKPIVPDSAGQTRTLKKNDTDWVSFSAVSGTSYRIFTEGSTDTRIKVYNASGSLLVEGDDSPNNLNALVDFNCTSIGAYSVAICGSDETVTGRYVLSISTSEGPDSYEPDSTPRLAEFITTGSAQNRKLSKGDVDWVAFTVSSANDTILLTAAGTCRIAMTLYDRDTSGKLATGEPGDSATKIRRYIAAPGTYFALISALDDKKSGTYRLTLQASSNGTLVTVDEYENDDTRASAKMLPGNSVIQQRSLTIGDTDWVRLPVLAGRQYTVNFSTSSTVRVAMYAKDGICLQEPLSSLFHNCSATDTVYLKIFSTSSLAAVSYPLILSVLLQPSIPDDYEVDNTKIQSKAKCAPSDSFIQDRTLTYINSVPDTDWVAFPVAAGKLYTIGASASTSTSLYMYLYDNVSTSYIKYSTSTSNTLTYTPTVSDTMYLVIYRPSLTTPIAYTLSVSGKFSNDSFEPDSSRSTADSLTTTSAQSRQLIPGDTDWVMFTVTPGDSVAILTSGTTDTKLALFTSSGSTPIIENDDILSGNVNALISWKSALGGQFYVRVTGKTAATTGAYTLQALSVKGGTMLIPDSLENDDSKSKARMITDSVLTGRVHSLHMNDTDWIAFPVVAGGQYTVSVSGASNIINVYVYNARDSLITTRTSTTSASVTYTPATSDTMYFRINSTMAIQRYTVSMSRIAPPSPDLFEPDNAKAAARVISDTIVSSEIHSLTAGDTDWVAFPALSGGQYTVSISCASSYYLNVHAYTARDSLFYSRTSTYTASTTRITNYNDTIYFRITSAAPVARYTVSMTRVAPYPADAFEVDNQRGLASPIAPDSVQQHTLAMLDSDWVKIALENGAAYRVVTTANFFHTTYLYFGTAASYAYGNSAATNTFNITATSDTLFVLVRQYSATSSYVGPYTIKISKRVEVPNRAIATGYSHSMIIKTDGSLWGAGDNSYGQLGDGTSTTRILPVQVASGVTAVAAGYQFSMFIKSDSSLWATGNNGSYQLGDGTSTSKSTPVKILTGVVSVSTGYYHTLAVKNDGTAWAMGTNSYGQLGDGTTTSRTTPVKVMDSIASVYAGYYHSFFIKQDGSLWAAGQNTNGQLGDGTTTSRTVPVKIMDNAIAAAGGVGHSIFLKGDSTVWTTGVNSDGQLGNGTSVSVSIPAQVMTGVAAIAAGTYHSLFVKVDASLWVAGRNSNGQLGLTSTADVLTPVSVATGVASAASSCVGTFTLIIKTNATVWGTGTNSTGQLGDGTTTNKTALVQMTF